MLENETSMNALVTNQQNYLFFAQAFLQQTVLT